VGFAALALLSSTWSAAPLLTVVRGAQLAVLVALAIVVPRVLGSAAAVRALGNAIVVYTIVCTVLAKLFPWAKGGTVDYLGFRRFTWFAVHPIVAATFAAVAALFVLVQLLTAEAPLRRRLFGFPLWMALPPLVAALIVTNSRGPLLAFALAAGVLLVLRATGALSRAVGLTVGLVAALLIVGSGETLTDLLERGRGGPAFVEKLLYRGQSLDEMTTITGRSELWEVTGSLIAERPALGVGYLGSRAALLEAAPWAAYAHNALLQTLVDVGIVGTLLLWLPMLGALFGGGFRDTRLSSNERLGRAAGVTMIAFLMINSISAESFAAAPGYETLLLFVAVILVERSRVAVRAAAPPPAAFPSAPVLRARSA
jgi:O-antigen ligase